MPLIISRTCQYCCKPVGVLDAAEPGSVHAPLDAVEQPAEADLATIGSEIQGFQDALCIFTDSFSLLCSPQDELHSEVVMLRDHIFIYVTVYQHLQLMMSKAFIGNLKAFLSSYAELDVHQFQQKIGDIAQSAAAYVEQAELVKALHLALAQSAEAKGLKKDSHRALASRVGATGGALVAGVSIGTALAIVALPAGAVALVASGVMGKSASRYYRKKQVAAKTASSEAQAHSKSSKLAAETVAGMVMTCINDFTSAIQQATQYFCRVATATIELKKGTEHADTAQQAQNLSRLKMHLAKMNRPATEVLALCSEFEAVLPLIEANMANLPLDRSWQSETYIQERLVSKDATLNLSRAIGDGTGWELLEATCPSVLNKVPEEVYTEIVMDNTHGTGVMTKTVTMEQVLATHADSSASETYTDEHNTTTKLGMEANIRIVPGVRLQPSAADAFAKTS
ncbi:hypothetical protein JKP88DRAFT_253621 [Tribonema minus]|uniref:Uncharacterized protein n=1 Tax=Tribonema minus TaxID=303371 RepID=A0A835ZDC6_9STRA|nr:hypothetical protein JKP88DRAFT_253621 [Tribonema minus]